MKKGIIGLCAAVVICSASVAQAQGHRGGGGWGGGGWHGGGWGGGGWWAPAIVGGAIAGALAAPYYAAPAPYYAPTYAPAPTYGVWWWCDTTQSYNPTRKLAPAGSEPFSHGETETKTRIDDISAGSCFFRFSPDPHWNPERSLVGFGIGVGGYERLVRVPRRVFQHLLAETPTPEPYVEACYVHRTRLELIAERKFRGRLLTGDAMSRSPVTICGSGRPHP